MTAGGNLILAEKDAVAYELIESDECERRLSLKLEVLLRQSEFCLL